MHTQVLIDLINQLLPEPQASLLSGMLFGIKNTMPPKFYAALVATGTIHVIALSGMNVSIIIRLLFEGSGALLGRIGGVVATILGILFYLWLVGPSPTIVRASIMGVLTVVAVFFGRPTIPLLILGITGSLMLAFQPVLIKNTSFQLSFLATLGIILFANRNWHVFTVAVRLFPQYFKNRETNKMIKTAQKIDTKDDRKKEKKHIGACVSEALVLLYTALKADLKITLSAQMFTFPVIAIVFHRISLVSPIANIFVGWLVAPITYLGFAMVGGALVFYPLGRVLSLIVWAPLTLFIWIVEFFSRIPYASISW